MHVYRETRFRQLVQEKHWTVYETFSIHFQKAARQAAEEDRDPQLEAVSVSARSFHRWMAGDLKRKPWPSTSRVLERLLGEPTAQLFGGPQAATASPPGSTSTGGGSDHPEGVMAFLAGQKVLSRAEEASSPYLAAVESFRRADRRLGGGHVYVAVQRYLRDTVSPNLFGAQGHHDSGEVFRAAAVLTEMAGWMAHDSGRDEQADEHFTKALGLAQAVPDPSVGANILASMSHLALQREDPVRATSLARVGRERITSAAHIPMLSARLHTMEARAHARSGPERTGATCSRRRPRGPGIFSRHATPPLGSSLRPRSTRQ